MATTIRVDEDVHKKIKMIARANRRGPGAQVALWADEAWEKAKKEGLVTDAMLTTPIKKKDAISAHPLALTA